MATIGPIHSGKAFTWKAGVGVAELSDFGKAHLVFGRLYDDACDLGFSVKSHKTNKIVDFYLSHEDKDVEGDVYGMHFYPVSHDLRMAGVRILIIND